MDASAFLSLLRRRWVPMAACLVAGVLGSLYVTATTPATYRASARLFVNIPAARGVQEALQGVQLSSQLLSSYSRIATSRAAAERVSDHLEGQFTAGEIRARLTATPERETLLIDVVAVDQDAQSARDIANAGAAVLIDFVSELEAGKEGAVEARLIDPAVVPGTPVSPDTTMNLGLGAGLGALIGLALALLLEATDRSVTTPGQAEAATGAPLLGVVPRHRHLAEEPLVALGSAGVPGGEAYRSLRTAVRFAAVSEPVRTIVVTSPVASEGKTVTAANLAVAFAQAGERVILVDGDLRRPSIAALFGVETEKGLTSVLLGDAEVDAVLHEWRERLTVLATGPLPPNPSEMAGSERMADLLETLSARADVVIIDTPPAVAVTDAVVLGALVDAVVLVIRHGRTHRIVAEEAAHRLERVGASVLGCVMNAVPRSRSRTAYPSYPSGGRRD